MQTIEMIAYPAVMNIPQQAASTEKLSAQLEILRVAAIRLGCYDAADVFRDLTTARPTDNDAFSVVRTIVQQRQTQTATADQIDLLVIAANRLGLVEAAAYFTNFSR